MGLTTAAHKFEYRSTKFEFSKQVKFDDLVKSLLERHPGESRGPDVVPTKVGNHLKDWIPVFTGNPGFRLSPE
jgi:hypothetical protein